MRPSLQDVCAPGILLFLVAEVLTCDAVKEEAPGPHSHPLVKENIVDRPGRGVRLSAVHSLGHEV